MSKGWNFSKKQSKNRPRMNFKNTPELVSFEGHKNLRKPSLFQQPVLEINLQSNVFFFLTDSIITNSRQLPAKGLFCIHIILTWSVTDSVIIWFYEIIFIALGCQTTRETSWSRYWPASQKEMARVLDSLSFSQPLPARRKMVTGKEYIFIFLNVLFIYIFLNTLHTKKLNNGFSTAKFLLFQR